MEIILVYLGGPSVNARVLKSRSEGQKALREMWLGVSQSDVMRETLNWPLLTLTECRAPGQGVRVPSRGYEKQMDSHVQCPEKKVAWLDTLILAQ